MQSQNPIFIPGPTNIPERIRLAMARPAWDHRTEAFEAFFGPLREDLKTVFGTEQGEVVLFTGSGTTGWDVALSNLLAPGDRVLATSHGMFSQRWIDLARSLGLVVDVIEAEWGEGIPMDAMESALAEDTQGAIKAVLAVHNETATGVTSDIGRVRQAMDQQQHPALLFVDGVSSIGSLPFHMDDWGVDVAVSGSQKGFMLPTGLAVVAISERAEQEAAARTHPRGHLDLGPMLKATRANSYPWTPAIGLIGALRESVDMLMEEGLPAVYARHTHLAGGVRAAAEAWGLPICAKHPALYSDTVTAIHVPAPHSAAELVAHANRRYGVSFGVGLGPLSDRVFRIGHLGQLTETLLLSGLATAEMALLDLGVAIEPGSGVAAAQGHFRAVIAESQEQIA